MYTCSESKQPKWPVFATLHLPSDAIVYILSYELDFFQYGHHFGALTINNKNTEEGLGQDISFPTKYLFQNW